MSGPVVQPHDDLRVASSEDDVLTDVAALVLTHRRPRLATQVVRWLLDSEGLPAERVLVVVNGEGGLADPQLESRCRVLRLPQNVGPAGGYRAGLELLAADPALRWTYLCEDDIGLLELPPGRLRRARLLAQQAEREGDRVAAVCAYARLLDTRTGRTRPAVPDRRLPLMPVDVAAWGATLLDLDVVRAGALPDASMFFGYEDFDYWLSVRRRGGRLALDTETSSVIYTRTFQQREQHLAEHRPLDVHEPWRRYYEARNFLVLARRYGHLGWLLDHMLKSARRWQLGPTREHRHAVVAGLLDAVRGRTGANPDFLRRTGEWEPSEVDGVQS